MHNSNTNMFRILQDFVQAYREEQQHAGTSDEEEVTTEIEQIFLVFEKEVDGVDLLPAFVVTTHERLWAQLSETLDIPLEQVEETAMRVVSQLMFEGTSSQEVAVLKQQFRQFHHTYILNARGSHQFFSQLLIAVCAPKALEQPQIEELLEVMYQEYQTLHNGLYEEHSFFHPQETPLPDNKNALKTRLSRKRIMEGKVLFQDVLDVLQDMAPPVVTSKKVVPSQPTRKKKSSSNFQKIKKVLAKTQQTAEQQQSNKLFKSLDKNGDKRLCHKEVKDFVESQPPLWAMLAVNLNLKESQCQRIATRVTLELAATDDNASNMVDKKQFHHFWSKFVQNPQGAQEFFHRCVFAAFDADGDGVLNPQELDNLLEVFYMEGSIFAGDARLPSTKDELRDQIKSNGNKEEQEQEEPNLAFEDIRGLISGHGVLA